MNKKEVYQEGVGGTFSSDGKFYDLNLLFKLAHKLPVQQMRVELLTWVIEEVYPIDEARVAAADYHVPVLVCKHGQHELVVDGLHRLIKAYRANEEYISCKYLTQRMLQQAELKDKKPAFFSW